MRNEEKNHYGRILSYEHVEREDELMHWIMRTFMCALSRGAKLIIFILFCYFIFIFFTLSFIFTSFREQDEAYINSLRWSGLVGLEPAYTRM